MLGFLRYPHPAMFITVLKALGFYSAILGISCHNLLTVFGKFQ